MPKQAKVVTGIERFVGEGCYDLKGARVGVIANQASVNNQFEHLVDLLIRNGAGSIVTIFAPEHGFRGVAQDMVSIESSIDTLTGIPVISLYGNTPESLAPSKEDLSKIDIIVFDLPDIGSRYYTFAQTLGYTMQMAGRLGVKVIVLDRPNPLGGEAIEGSPLLKKCRSFCGFAPVANRHGLTMGELAILMQKGFGSGEDAFIPIDCELEVIELRGWKRSWYFDETGLPWIYPSPNMPTLDTAIVYPGGCLWECTNVSEGRGTTKPFELMGAPFIESTTWIEMALRENVELEGAMLRPASFMPGFQKWAGKTCNGIQLHVTDRHKFRPYRWYLALINSLRKLYPEDFSWKSGVYEFVDTAKTPAIDLLYGSSEFRECVDGTGDLGKVVSKLEKFEERFKKEREDFLLYR